MDFFLFQFVFYLHYQQVLELSTNIFVTEIIIINMLIYFCFIII